MIPEAVPSPMVAWESFYVIVGSSAAALTGLQFVVMALIPESEVKASSNTIAAFGTPTIVHFCVALLVSGILSAPWSSLLNASLALGVAGVGGVVYVIVVLLRARRQSDYAPVMEDWIWHTILPFVAYIALTASALMLGRGPVSSLFVTAAAALGLVFIGIHNAWDTVIFIAIDKAKTVTNKKRK